MKLSIAIAAYNEEKNIEKCLASVFPLASEIILVDGSSTDRTVILAKKFHAKIIKSDNPPIFHINKQKAIDNCHGDWILQLDADEIVGESLRDEIRKSINPSQKLSGFYLPRRNYFLGKWLKKGGVYPDYVVRLFKKGKGFLPCLSVHEQIEVEGKLGYLKNDLYHYPYPKFHDYLVKADKYTDLTAIELKNKGYGYQSKMAFQYLLVIPISKFINIYFRHKGFLDGWPGFIWALFSGLHYPLAYFKYLRLT